MNYVERNVRSAPGLSQEAALDSLQSHPNFRPGTKIASLRRRGERWVAVLHVPKTAGEFPPSDDGGEEGPPKPPKDEGGDDPDDGSPPPDDGGGDPFGGPPEGDEGGEKKPGKGGTEELMLHVLTEILHALKGGPDMGGMGGPDDMGPGGPPPGGPPPGPSGSAGMQPGKAPSKLGPGEVLPHQTPIGAPAFASTHPLAQRLAKIAGRKRHIPVSSPAGMTIKQAKAELDPIAEFFGYRVAQVRYCGPTCPCKHSGSNQIHALLEVQ